MTDIRALVTPALVLDAAIMERNIARAADRSHALGIPLRPHIKTPKCLEVADRLLARQAHGLTVSTLREAEALLGHGIRDLFYAVELAPRKAPLILDMRRRGADLKGLTDSLESARAIEDCCSGKDRLPLFVGLDTDGYRGGLRADDPELIALCRFLDRSARLAFAGLMTYAGASYHAPDPSAKARIIEEQCEAASSVASRLAGDGIATPSVSVGSTPAWMSASVLHGATELRGGIYVFQDLFQAGMGHCRIEDIALSVVTTVIGVQPRRNRFFIDAGALALSKDRSTAGHEFDAGYGLLVRCEDGQVLDDLVVSSVHQEHGIVSSRSGREIDFSWIRPGQVVRVLPNHSDMTAAAYEHYHVVRSDCDVIERWSRFNGWEPQQL